MNFGPSLHIPRRTSRHLHVGLLLGSAASSFHHYFLKLRSQEGRGVLQLLGSPKLTGVHGAPSPGALWWEGTFSVLCPGPPALPAVLRRGGQPTGPREPHLQTPNIPKSSCQLPWPHVAQRTSHRNGPLMPRHSGVRTKTRSFISNWKDLGSVQGHSQRQAKLPGLE